MVKIKVDATELTLAEHAEAARIVAETGIPADDPGAQFYTVAAMAFLEHRKVDPSFTYEQALQLKMGDLDIVNDDDGAAAPEVPSERRGDAPPMSLASGS